MKIPSISANFSILKHGIKPVSFGTSRVCGAQISDEGDIFERTDTYTVIMPGNSDRALKRGQFLIGGEVFLAHSTEMFRSDLNWQEFGSYLKHKFKNQDCVNTYIYGCSDGSEAYTMSILLQNIFKDDAGKFFPIRAKDISEETIQTNIMAQEKGVRKYQNAYIKAQVGTGMFEKSDIERYMSEIRSSNTNIFSPGAALTNQTTAPVLFECANILDDVENIDSSTPSIVMMRNMWPYVDSLEYKNFAKELYNKLKDGSIVVIGDFDYAKIDSVNFPPELIKAGFRPVKNKITMNKNHPLVFEKRPKILSFKGRGEVLCSDGTVFNRNTTYMFRGDLNWKHFGNFLVGRFSEYDKVNVYNYAASTGYEPYSLSILLQSRFGNDAKKFFPIMAKDIDKEMIEENIANQKAGNVKITEGYDRAQRILRLDRDELLTYMKPDLYFYDATLHKKVTEPVEFSCANILDDVENIDSSTPSIVMMRNMWPYVNPCEYEDFAKRLYDKLAPGSCVVIGDFDYSNDETISPKLIKAGFEPFLDDKECLIFLKD